MSCLKKLTKSYNSLSKNSIPNCRTHILRHVVDFDVCCIGNKSQFLVLCTRDTAITLFRCIIRYQQCYQLSSVTSDWIDLCSVLRRIETEILLYITAEIGLWREAEHIGNLHERQWLITQQAWNIKYCITVNPIVGGISAHLFNTSDKYFDVMHKQST